MLKFGEIIKYSLLKECSFSNTSPTPLAKPLFCSKKIGTSALQSRACAGVRNGTYLFALPGSPSACRDAWENLLRPQFDYRHLPCNFVEIMPRLVKDSIDKS